MILCAAEMSSGTINHNFQFSWEKKYPTILEFAVTGKYLFKKKFIRLMRGSAGAHGGTQMFAFDLNHNFPFPSDDIVGKYEESPVFESGVDFTQLQALIENLHDSNICQTVVKSSAATVFLGIMARDGTPLKQSVKRYGDSIVGLRFPVNHLDYESKLQSIAQQDFVTAADEVWFNSLDDKVGGSIGVFYEAATKPKNHLCLQVVNTVKLGELCLECIRRENYDCIVYCNACETTKVLCKECEQAGHTSWSQFYRSCLTCLKKKAKCVRLKIIGCSLDNEAINFSLMNFLTTHVDSMQLFPLPDAVHVLKLERNSCFNWWLWINGARVNTAILLVLRNDTNPQVNALIRKAVTAKAVRNRDKMCVETLLTLTSDSAIACTQSVPLAVVTIIPSPYYYTERIPSKITPYGVTQHPKGHLFVSDKQNGKIWVVHLSYPCKVVELWRGLNHPTAIFWSDDKIWFLAKGIRIYFSKH
jgi:hypothetical protein